MIVLRSAGSYAYTPKEKETMLRSALTAHHDPWLTIFSVGAACERRQMLAWFPCALLVSAVPRSRRVALEYRSWLPDATPRFGLKVVRQVYDELTRTIETGAWISQNNAGIHSTDLFLRGNQADWRPDNDAEADPVYFPGSATVTKLDAARTLRAFFRTGRRSDHITWTGSTPNTATTDLDAIPLGATT